MPSTKGVRVYGTVRDYQGAVVSGKTVTVSLSVVCAWNGKILQRKQTTTTNTQGKFQFYLPPNSELSAVSTGDTAPDSYAIVIEDVGAWMFEVPADVDSLDLST